MKNDEWMREAMILQLRLLRAIAVEALKEYPSKEHGLTVEFDTLLHEHINIANPRSK